ncbi:hypothetical protein N7931_09820 [Catenovulum sp. 2E275]|uniref:hypothetical protein n=1 Tax=Catenovulum sp. 2E275 TaxID=2980497 RepID=UPI0021CFB97A|nr:hypothetical protein [Catenovulum sp. 2E275]MCU4675931.1 hypothetical protein [Catenovulum sp. 2E275]
MLRVSLKTSQQWPWVIRGILFCWWLLTLLILWPVETLMAALLLLLNAGTAFYIGQIIITQYSQSMPKILQFTDDNGCLLDGVQYSVLWHSFYFGDWFYLNLSNEMLAPKKFKLILSPDMLNQTQKSQLRRYLKQHNRAFRKQS